MNSLEGAAVPDDSTPDTWHPDPLGSKHERKWDGQKWTQEVRKAQVKAEAPTMPPPPGTPPAAPKASPASESKDGKVRDWIRQKPIAAVSIAAGAAVVLGMLIGWAGEAGTVEERDETIAQQEQQIAELEGSIETVQSEADQIRQDGADLQVALEAEAKTVRRKAAAVRKREKAVSQTEQTIANNTITDGIWEIGSDFEPGTYRAPGGGGCYWATLGSADTSDITNNGFAGANQTVTLSTGWFETSDCGDWTKIG